MGVWGTALYSDDTASDVRDICNEVYSLVDMDEAERIIFNEYEEIAGSSETDNDHAVFWYALADWQWNHGVLSNNVKEKALELINIYAGIEEWKESGGQADVRKRIEVLNKLYEKITSPQPSVKLSKAKLAKAKHKPGDIIIFKTCDKSHDPENNIWSIEHCSEITCVYENVRYEKAPTILDPPYDAHGKYMAVLCVGTEKISHSQYVDGYDDEYSKYVLYDYISDVKPSLEVLGKCGFIPCLLRYSRDRGFGIDTIGWTYTFVLYSYSFRKRKGACEEITGKYYSEAEAERFLKLFSEKRYLEESLVEFELYDMFGDFFMEKARFSYINESLDNLSDEKAFNPAFKPLEEINKLLYEKYIE